MASPFTRAVQDLLGALTRAETDEDGAAVAAAAARARTLHIPKDLAKTLAAMERAFTASEADLAKLLPRARAKIEPWAEPAFAD